MANFKAYKKTLDLMREDFLSDVHKLQIHNDFILSLSISPDGRFLASCGNVFLKVTEISTLKEVYCIQAHNGAAVVTAIYSPNGTRILTSGDDSTIRILSSTDGRELAKYPYVTDGAGFGAFWHPKSRSFLIMVNQLGL